MVLKHIKGPEGTQLAINNGIIPLVNQDLLKVEGFKIDDNMMQQIIAYQYSEVTPLQAFAQNQKLRGWDLFLENDFRQQISDAFLNKKSTKIIQDEIKKTIGDWLTKNDIIIEGLNDQPEVSEEPDATNVEADN